MREVLWLLMYPVSSYIFRKNEEGDFELKSSISLPSLSMLAKLDSFICLYECPEMEPPTPVTLLAYAAGLRLWRRTFQKNICILEGIVKKQEKFCTLSWLQSELNSWFRVLSTIYSVHYAAFCVGEDNSPRNLALRCKSDSSDGNTLKKRATIPMEVKLEILISMEKGENLLLD
ncbi:hypothetical protein SK128_020639 [Halocaridina rubra]|uniref:Uncharacterized protein n=1 Tax=Halocaridina rubra TaxID=373956 RepID=A0AAN8WGM4_HALRR